MVTSISSMSLFWDNYVTGYIFFTHTDLLCKRCRHHHGWFKIWEPKEWRFNVWNETTVTRERRDNRPRSAASHHCFQWWWAACQCSSRFEFGSIVRALVCVRALFRQVCCSNDLYLAQTVTLFSCFVRVQLFYTDQWYSSLYRIEWSLDAGIHQLQNCRRISFVKSSKPPFRSAHEAGHHSTARLHECDTWLSFALCHCSDEK